MSVEIVSIGPGNAGLFKEVRLRALKDTPLAFGSTYAKESLLADADWERRAAGWCNGGSAGFLTLDGTVGCGIAAGFVDQDDPARAHLVSMWVAPTHRRLGVGRLLVGSVATWAAGHGCRQIVLNVTSVNDAAMRFYEQLGFTMTGKTEPYPNDPGIIEYQMGMRLPNSPSSNQ
jgi:ribosomal protein S18 acetylase RimI-like enzyme